MSEQISGQGPAVVLRSQYTHMRTLLAIALSAAIAFGVALILVVAIGGGSTTTGSAAVAPPAAATASPTCGRHYEGSSLVQGSPCAKAVAGSSSGCGTRYEGSSLVHGAPCPRQSSGR